MDFRLTEQQELLVKTAREFFQQHCPTTRVQELTIEAQGFPAELWRHISSLGWPGLLIPEVWGGTGGSVLDVILLIEEMGRACFPSPYIQSAVVATSLLLAAGSQSQQARLLPLMARGERLCALALTEESADFVPEAVAMQGEVGGYLNGGKLFIKDAHLADDLIIVTRGNGGVNLLLVEPNQPGITLLPMETISGEKLFEVALRGVAVHREMLLGASGQGWKVLAPILRMGALARCAEMVGCAQRILDLCVDYAKSREQSGRPIGSFQAIQHHCANLLRNVEGARYILYHAAWKMQEGFDSNAEVAMAKAYANEACLWVARQGHQILGAISYCEEHPLHLFHKRIQAAGLDFGDASLHFETVAQAIGLG
jgi:alkylation response protein AidB-like acyl-CoA dehydrogenase